MDGKITYPVITLKYLKLQLCIMSLGNNTTNVSVNWFINQLVIADRSHIIVTDAYGKP